MGKESNTFVRKLTHLLQKNVSKLSCDFLNHCLLEINADCNRVYLLNRLYTRGQDGRHLMPCFEATKIVIDHLENSKRLVRLQVNRTYNEGTDQVTLLLRYSAEENKYILTTPSNEEQTEPVILFKGISRDTNSELLSQGQYIKTLLAIGFRDIILSNVAQHCQYAGSAFKNKINPYKEIDNHGLPGIFVEYKITAEKEILKYRHLAGEIGCLPQNPSLFLLTHVRCNDSNALEQTIDVETALYL